MAPLNSITLESVYPVYTISCADALLAYSEKKSLHGDPSISAEENEKLTNCFVEALNKLKETPCAEIQKAYAECLSAKRNNRVPCKQLKATLEECTAKHIGKLD